VRAGVSHVLSGLFQKKVVLTLYRHVEQRLARLVSAGHADLLQQGLVGLEKESLRVSREGGLAQTDHPRALGSPLTNPYITTDYSEALLEFITPPMHDLRDALQFLCDAQQFVYERLEDELLWATSMPCVIAGETSIPIARYGTSNAGMMKHIYRRGLGYRYGRTMQVIAGVHFNYSFSDAFWRAYQALEGDGGPMRGFVDRSYFSLIRNMQRVGWLIPYLFGASPAVCRSFLGGKPTSLEPFDGGTCYEPFATSLRMGDIGYQNNKENEHGIKACYDSLEAYVDSLTCAITTPCPDYQRIGVKVDGDYRQLNANILQIENEYYSTVRPKQPLESVMEKPVQALRRRGVGYLELRSIDVNAFDPLGINEEQLRFIEALLVFCLLADSPTIGPDEQRAIDANEMVTAHRGREPGLALVRDGQPILLRDWAAEVLAAMEGICELLDAGMSDRPYSSSLAAQRAAVDDPERTPSARMLAEMRSHGEGFFDFAARMSRVHQRYFQQRAVDPERVALFTRTAEESLRRQAQIEASDSLSLDAYLERYFAQS